MKVLDVNTLATARKTGTVNTLHLHEQNPLKVLTHNTLDAALFVF